MVEHVPRNHKKNKQHRMRDVKLSASEKSKLKPTLHEVQSHTTRSFDRYESTQSPLWLFVRSLSILLGILALVIFLGARLFARAHITITPHTLTGDIDTVLDFTPASGAHTYETMVLTREKVQQVLVEDFTTQESRSSGTIVIFNEEPTAQRLREETRFQTPEGLVFMLGKDAGVTVPAAQGSTPGSVEVTVYAQEPGDAYNIGPSDFVIPGWQEINDPRFTTQYARSKGPMSNGGSGPTPIVSDELRAVITQEMQQSLREQMIAQAWVDAPDQFILFEDLVDIEFSPLVLSDIQSDTMSATASMTGTLSAILFRHDDLAQIFAQEISDTYVGESVRINNPSTLQTNLSPQSRALLGWGTPVSTTSSALDIDTTQEPTDTSSLEEETLSIRFIGSIDMTMHVDRQRILMDLAHMDIKNIRSYFSQIPEIRTAQVSIKPFWRKKVPDSKHTSLIISNNL